MSREHQAYAVSDARADCAESDALESGNYVDAARHDPVDWRRAAARALLGIEDDNVEILDAAPSPGARFFAAAAHWMRGDETAALARLSDVSLPEARRLAALIRQPRIHVLAQLPWTRRGPQDLLSATMRDEKFVVRNISFHPDDVPNVPRADVRRFVEQGPPPDFYICQMVEWHVLPPNLRDLGCPLFGQTSDYDLHIHAVEPWLRLFDEIVVLDPEERTGVRTLIGDVAVSTCPKSFGIAEMLPPVPTAARDIDLFLSGTLRHPFNPDKAALAAAVVDLPGVDVLMVNGFLGATDYLAALGRTKATYTYVRRPASMPTRGLESLAMGCATLVQAGSVLDLWAGADEGLHTYDNTPAGLVSSLAEVLAAWPSWSARARRGAALIRREFAFPRVASQFLRFLTVRCALIPERRPRSTPDQQAALDQRRPVVWKGWLPPGRPVQDALRKAALDHWGRRRSHGETAAILNVMAREHLLAHAEETGRRAMVKGRPWESAHLDAALELYREGIATFPRDLALHFNFMRAALHFGNAPACAEGLDAARRVLDAPAAAWRIDRTDDVLTWDFCPGYFDFRQYIDLVAFGGDVATALSRIIRASAHYYLAQFEQVDDHLAAAVDLNPRFAPYRFAQAMSWAEDAASRREAIAALGALAHDSVLFVEARQWLAAIDPSPERRAALQRVQAVIAEIGTPFDDLLPFARSRALTVPGVVDPAVSAWTRVVAVTSAGRDRPGLLGRLGRKWLAHRLRRHLTVAVFGTGPGGAAVLTRVEQLGATVVGFIDNQVGFNGRRFLDRPVHPVSRVSEDGLGATAIVLSSHSRSVEMRGEIEALSCNLDVIDFHYWDALTSTKIRRSLKNSLRARRALR